MGFAFVHFDNKDDKEAFKSFLNEYRYGYCLSHVPFIGWVLNKYFCCCSKYGDDNTDSAFEGIIDWSIQDAPLPNNIVWENYDNLKLWDTMVSFILNILLFLLTIIVVTPSNNILFLTNTVKFLKLNQFANTTGIMTYTAIDYGIKVTALALCNSFIIPFLVYYFVEFMKWEKHSDRERSKLWRYFFYIIFNTLILPLLNFEQFVDFMNKDRKRNITQTVRYWQNTVSPNLVNSSFTFLKYLIISGCFSMPIVLLALGHWIWHAVERCCIKSKEQ